MKRQIEADQPIEIRPAGNGFFVTARRDVSRGDRDDPPPLVFESFNGLLSWLAKHFSHRNTATLQD